MKKLPEDVYYCGGRSQLWFRWNGRPEGKVYGTGNRALAWESETEFNWQTTPFNGANGQCRPAKIAELVRKYYKSLA